MGCAANRFVLPFRNYGLWLSWLLQVGDMLVEAFAKLLFVHGHVHADLHPGRYRSHNIMHQPKLKANINLKLKFIT